MNIKKEDKVKILTGKDKGKSGKVMQVDRKKGMLYVEGVNMLKRHKRANPQNNQPGGIIEREGPIHPSNVKLIK